MEKQESKFSFSRRNFIKGAAIIGATGALTGCSAQGANQAADGRPCARDADILRRMPFAMRKRVLP